MSGQTSRETDVEQCVVYGTFGDCASGFAKCDRKHEGQIHQQTYFYCKIEDMSNSNRILIRRRLRGIDTSEEYYVAKLDWHMAGAECGNFVLFQASSKEIRHGRGRRQVTLKVGRVVKNLEKCGELEGEIVVPTASQQWKVYTIDSPETKLYDDGFSVENCDQHANCKRIGIHISACALEDPFKIDCQRIPTRGSRFRRSSPLFNLQKDNVALVLSVFAHSNSEEIHGPVFSQVKVAENFIHSDCQKFEHHFNVLWPRFARESDRNWIFNKEMQKYLARYPDSWKQRYLVEEMMTIFHSTIRSSVPSRHLITKIWKESEDSADQNYVSIFKDIYDEAKDAKHSKDERILALASGGMRLRKSRNMAKSLLPKYTYDVEKFSSREDSKKVLLCTSPLGKFIHYVNQQILIGHFMSRQVYGADELRGMLGIRFTTPQLRIAQVKKMGEKTFELEYLQMQNLHDTLCEVPYAIFSENARVEDGNLEVTLKGLCCSDTEEYCNRDLVHVDGAAFKNFLFKMTNMKSLDDTSFTEMEDENADEEKSPYRREVDDTIFKLQAGVQLQIQISKPDAVFNTHLGIRLLRIGRNRHLCLSHLNHPELAFASDRKDVRRLVTSERITALKNASLCDRKSGVIVEDVKLQWADSYYSGGSFPASGLVIKEGALLCIRDDVMKNNEVATKDEVKYVWCCHGVVRVVDEDKVTFAVCSLSQSERHQDSGLFCVEVIE